jgi:hypothetical protein
MNGLCKLLVLVSVFLALAASACSKEKSHEDQGRGIKTSTHQAAEAIEEYGKRPVDKAKKTQSLGEDRVRGIDEATENMDRR